MVRSDKYLIFSAKATSSHATLGRPAGEMGMAPRSLHRHLAAEGTSFRQLLDEVREVLSEEMLAHRMTIDEVAERLGYAEASSFVHAFKRWKGMSPRTYRQRGPERSRGRARRAS